MLIIKHLQRGGGYVTPNVCYIEENEGLVFKPEINDNNTLQFPLYFNLTKINNDEYKMEPTPESIAFADYFNENAVWDGAYGWSLEFEPGTLYIDGVEIQCISKPGGANGIKEDYVDWFPSYDYDVGRFEMRVFNTNLEGYYPKGTFVVYNDD